MHYMHTDAVRSQLQVDEAALWIERYSRKEQHVAITSWITISITISSMFGGSRRSKITSILPSANILSMFVSQGVIRRR